MCQSRFYPEANGENCGEGSCPTAAKYREDIPTATHGRPCSRLTHSLQPVESSHRSWLQAGIVAHGEEHKMQQVYPEGLQAHGKDSCLRCS